jgi:hypothetical protein
VEELHIKRQSKGLDPAEENELKDLVRQYELAILQRAQAAALLRQRGHNVDTLLGQR